MDYSLKPKKKKKPTCLNWLGLEYNIFDMIT